MDIFLLQFFFFFFFKSVVVSADTVIATFFPTMVAKSKTDAKDTRFLALADSPPL